MNGVEWTARSPGELPVRTQGRFLTMHMRLAQLSLATMLAFGVASGAAAQSRAGAEVVPVYSTSSSKPDAYLLLEPSDGNQVGARWQLGGKDTLDAAFGLQAGDSLALLCDRKTGLGATLASLPNNNCALRAISDDGSGSTHASATASFGRNGNRIGASIGGGRANLPAWLTPGGKRLGTSSTVNVNDLTVFAQKDIGRKGTVSIAGTLAKAQLIPAGDAPANLTDRWTSKTFSVGGGYGAFSANIIGHVVDVPGQNSFEGLGLGLTWRTPWSGQLTVGADNLVTRGKNPFSPSADPKQDEGAIPYVRYEQDL